jgi:hypothetical protein
MDRRFKNAVHPPERVLTLGKRPKRPADLRGTPLDWIVGDVTPGDEMPTHPSRMVVACGYTFQLRHLRYDFLPWQT